MSKCNTLTRVALVQVSHQRRRGSASLRAAQCVSETDAMDSTPTKPAYRPLEIETPGLRRLEDDESSGEYGSSGTPGSPSKRGGPTLWTKNDDSDDEGVNRVRANKENDASVLTQVTHATAAPIYGTASQPMSFKRKKGGGGGGRGFLASLFCCGQLEAEDHPYVHRQVRANDGTRAARGVLSFPRALGLLYSLLTPPTSPNPTVTFDALAV